MKQDIRPLMWYPVVYLLTTICPLINRLVQLVVVIYSLCRTCHADNKICLLLYSSRFLSARYTLQNNFGKLTEDQCNPIISVRN